MTSLDVTQRGHLDQLRRAERWDGLFAYPHSTYRGSLVWYLESYKLAVYEARRDVTVTNSSGVDPEDWKFLWEADLPRRSSWTLAHSGSFPAGKTLFFQHNQTLEPVFWKAKIATSSGPPANPQYRIGRRGDLKPVWEEVMTRPDERNYKWSLVAELARKRVLLNE